MGRIRSIKPEFPQSESIGRLSREARLLFIQIWTLVDDSGRARGTSRMLASLLYPYDPDAPMLIGAWLDELEREDHVRRYTVDGQTYLDVPKFLEHQKIDKPSKSKLPAFENPRECSPNPREVSTTDQDQGRDQGEEGKGEDQGACAPGPHPPKSAVPDSVDTRILCERVGVFRVKEQMEIALCFAAFVRASGLSVDAAMEHMVERWAEYQVSSPQLEWQWGSAFSFFMSGKWDDPRSWPRGKEAKLEAQYSEFLKGK